MKKKLRIYANKYAIAMLLFVFSIIELSAQSGIYVGGHFRRERSHTIDDLKASGFQYVILFNINVESNGDLTTDGETICSDGNYVFNNTQPYYIDDVTALKTGTTSITRVEQCIGGWGNHSYTNIKNLIASEGTGTSSILYRNFQALKNAIPSIDAINNDDEEAYDVNSATAFHVMLADIGFKTSIAPYMNKNYWESLTTNINNQRTGTVDFIYLQCYDGGAGNNPCDWDINGITMHTGGLTYEDQNALVDKMISARDNCNSKGGFFWVYNDNTVNLATLASNVNYIFRNFEVNLQEPCIFYNNIDYGFFENGLAVGEYNVSDLEAAGITTNSISSLKVLEGFNVIAYDGDNFDGESTTLTGDIDFIGSDWNDRISSIKIVSDGDTGLEGTYYLQNRNSGLYMDVEGGPTNVEDGANIQQYYCTGNTNQQFQFTHLGDGTYKITAVNSGKAIDVSNFSKDNFANIHQYTYDDLLNQQFVVVEVDNSYYKLVSKNSGKIIEVLYSSSDAGANVNQYDNNGQTGGQWKLIAVNKIATDITNIEGTINVQYDDAGLDERYPNLIDDNINTKYLTFHDAGWVQYQSNSDCFISSYTITSANDHHERDPLNWTLEASKDGIDWAIIDSRTGEDFTEFLQTRSFNVSSPGAYSYFRFNLTNNSGTVLQLAEIELIGVEVGLNDITNEGGTITAQYDDSDTYERYPNLIDNNVNTKYLTFHDSGWIQYQALGSYVINGYTITSANDEHDRDPLNWSLYGSNDGSNWATLDIRTGEEFTDYLQTKSFSFVNSTAYTYYRLDMTNNSGSILQLAEIELLGYQALKNATIVQPMSDSENFVEFYPNPANEYLNINNYEANYSVEIFNMAGMLKYRKTNNSGPCQIDIQKYPNGMYILNINSNISKISKKLIIKH